MSRAQRSYTPGEAVARLVEGCRRRAAVAHLARALCGALSAAFLTVALVVSGGRSWGDPEGLALGLSVGLLALLGWARSARVSDAEVASAIDRSLPGAGLLAAYERARRGRASAVGELAARRAYRAIPRARADEAVVPVAVPFLVLPLGAVAALLLAVQMNDAEAARLRARGLALESLAHDLAAAADRHGEALGAAGEAALDAVADEVSAAAEGASPSAANATPSVRWSERIEEAAADAPPGVRDALHRLALEAELAAPGVEQDPFAAASRVEGEPGPRPGEAANATPVPAEDAAGRTRAAGEAPRSEAPGDKDAAARESGQSGAANGEGRGDARVAAPGEGGSSEGGDGAMASPARTEAVARDSASAREERAPASPSEPGAAGSPSGTPAASPAPPRTAPPRHRALVRAWLASRE